MQLACLTSRESTVRLALAAVDPVLPCELFEPGAERILLDSCVISARLRNVLDAYMWRRGRERGITLGDLAAIPEHELLHMKGMGRTSLEELQRLLQKHGLNFKGGLL